jgi:hypothetical protein
MERPSGEAFRIRRDLEGMRHNLSGAGPYRIASQGLEPHLTQKGQPELVPT